MLVLSQGLVSYLLTMKLHQEGERKLRPSPKMQSFARAHGVNGQLGQRRQL